MYKRKGFWIPLNFRWQNMGDWELHEITIEQTLLMFTKVG